MALIKCPECEKDISDKSLVCIHCGFPISQIKLYNVVRPYLAEPGRYVLEYENLTVEQAEERKKECEKLEKELGGRNTFEIVESDTRLDYCNLELRKIKINTDKPTPTCPRCGSTSISTGARGVNQFWGFIGASKTVNRCAKCGHMWEPKG